MYEMYDADTNGALFTLAEESGCCERVCCGPQRSLEIIMMEISTDGLDARTRDSVDARYATPASTTGSLKYNHCMSKQQVKPKTMVKFERPFRFGYGGCCPGYRQEMRAGLSMNVRQSPPPRAPQRGSPRRAALNGGALLRRALMSPSAS